MINLNQCSLCFSRNIKLFFESDRKNLIRNYFRCEVCNLVFVPSDFHLDDHQEKQRYLEHENFPYDTEYRNFLNRLKSQIDPLININSIGLDFGCGPAPTLSLMFEEEGLKMNTYDKYFADEKKYLDELYDFVVCSETIEHFKDVKFEFDRLFKLLQPKGVLGLMTSIFYEDIEFSDWHYKLDPTHIAFYSPQTIEFIEKFWDWEIILKKKNIVIFKKY